ncbi:phosphotransferase [Trichophyton tonsurans CBS 112818]|uniref:Phosphotransferase enzyme family protein n=2 Tax=Trichophyton TaxID=5550 RepID=F2PHA4_TRIEC|nr:phosphotransferase [Trichophyton tonsurans CBS 112818]EGE01272.1 phosphotransferase enzyme family protein [Trichophyton equinum CBS 127.97]
MAFRLELGCSELARAKEKEVDFLESSFFRGNKSLPKPSEVTTRSPNFNTRPRPALARFEALNLIVKFGSSVAIEEALCLRSLTRGPLPDYVLQSMSWTGPYKTVKRF